MKILIICSGKPSNPQWSFELTRSYVYEQAESLKKLGIEYDTYFIEGKGLFGYLKNYSSMIKKIKKSQPDLIHAHYGLSGLLTNLQRKIPVITTFHGSDINVKKNRKFSYLASKLSADNIFVHKNHPAKINYRNKVNFIPCGVDTKVFFPIDKNEARNRLKLEPNKIYGLFTGSFTNHVKNYSLAEETIVKSSNEIDVLELKGYTREEVCLLLNAVDFLLMTSFTEGSPLIIKEAMCCNCPIVSVDVGNVKDTISKIEGSYLVTSYDSIKLAQSIDKIIERNNRTNSREKALQYDLSEVAKEVFKIYRKVESGN